MLTTPRKQLAGGRNPMERSCVEVLMRDPLDLRGRVRCPRGQIERVTVFDTSGVSCCLGKV